MCLGIFRNQRRSGSFSLTTEVRRLHPKQDRLWEGGGREEEEIAASVDTSYLPACIHVHVGK